MTEPTAYNAQPEPDAPSTHVSFEGSWGCVAVFLVCTILCCGGGWWLFTPSTDHVDCPIPGFTYCARDGGVEELRVTSHETFPHEVGVRRVLNPMVRHPAVDVADFKRGYVRCTAETD